VVRTPRTVDHAARRRQVAVVAVLAAFLALALSYALLVPMFENADESFHASYVQGIADDVALPGAGVVEKQQPPLYYLLAAGVLKLTGNLYAVRVLSVAIGVIALLLVLATAREILPRHPGAAVLAMAAAAALPSVQSVSAAISDDVLAWAAGAGVIWCTVRLVRVPVPSRRLYLACGIAAGVALLSKETAWPLLGPLAVAIAWRMWPRPRWPDVAAAVLPAAGIAGWWFVRNIVQFHALTPPLAPLNDTHPYLRSWDTLQQFASSAVRTLFGPERSDGGAVVRGLGGQVLVGVTAVGALLALAAAAWLLWRRYPSLTVRGRRVVIALLPAAALVLVAWVVNSIVFDLQPQARYILAAVAIPASALAWLAAQVWGRAQRGGRIAMILAAGVPLLLVVLDSLRIAVDRPPA
jgi:4-amino-4-deoxy-L-arabinose transferase-like glycosyltransferase